MSSRVPAVRFALVTALALAACSSSTSASTGGSRSTGASATGQSGTQSTGHTSSGASSQGTGAASGVTSSGSGTGRASAAGSSSGLSATASSSSAGTSSGGTGLDAGSCTSDIPFGACASDPTVCASCNLICVLEPNVLEQFNNPTPEQICEPPCATSDDCPLPNTACRDTDAGAACQFALCGKSGRCDAADAGDGTCDFFGQCFQNGSATSVCDTSSRTAVDLCAGGELCVGSDECGPGCSGPGVCRTACGKGHACPSGTACAVLNTAISQGVTPGAWYEIADAGTCEPLLSGTSLPACPPGFNDGYFIQCTTNAGCPNFQTCVPNIAASGNICACGCASTSDCPQVDATCVSGSCQQNQCPSNASAGDACDALGTGDGTCDSLLICHQAGTATSRCATSADRNRPDLLCPVGKLCVAVDAGVWGTCATL